MDKRESIFEYIINEEANFKTVRIPITTSTDWNMHEHIERCTNVSNGWFHSGKNDGLRPNEDIVTPILNVALRSEGFDVKDIVPYVNDKDNYYKSFVIKKYHPRWARKYNIDTFLDELVKSSLVYDLALVKDVNGVRPEVVPLQSIAFCDQTDVLAGPICIKHQYSVPELLEFKGKWDSNKIDEAITMAKYSKVVSQSNDQEAKTPGKYIEVYELHGTLPKYWLEDGADEFDYEKQLQIITFYTDKSGKKNGITLFKGREPKSKFKALVIDKIYGRACGRSLVEKLFEPQVWTNYSSIRIKELLDAAALVVWQTDSDEWGDQKIVKLKTNTIIKHEQGKPITKMDTNVPNITAFTNHKAQMAESARGLGSASEASLGKNPVSGTPFALQNLIVQQGQGIHEWKQGVIASFVADELYRDWVLKYLVAEINSGQEFLEELTLEELIQVTEEIAENEIEKRVRDMIINKGVVPTAEEKEMMLQTFKEEFKKGGKSRFIKIVKDELAKIPIDVYVNITGKQKLMAENVDKLSKFVAQILANPQAFAQIPGLGKVYNEILEDSNLSPIDFTEIVKVEEKQEPKAPMVEGANKETVPTQ